MSLPVMPNEYWSAILVNHDRLKARWADASVRGSLATFLSSLPSDNLGLIGDFCGVPVDTSQYVQQSALHLASSDEGLVLSCLRDFADSKPQSISSYWLISRKVSPPGIESLTTFAKLVKIFADDPGDLQRIFVLQYWMNRASGRIFSARNIVNEDVLVAGCSRLPGLINNIAEGPYRLYGTCPTPEGTIFMLYRQDPERLLEGFAHPLRYVGAKPVLFQVSRGTSVSFLEVKADLISVQDATVQAIGQVVKTVWSDKDDAPFATYETQDIQAVIQRGGVDRTLNVTGIEFDNVRLKSPGTVLTLQAVEDVADSLEQLTEINPELTLIQSLLDLRRIKIRVPGDAGERWVECKHLTSGGIMFVLDDRRLLPDQVKKAKDLFLGVVPISVELRDGLFLQF